MISGRIPPAERSAVADPGNQTTMEMHSGAIIAQVRTGDGQIVGDDVHPAGEIVPEGDLDRRTFLANDYPAQVLVVLTGEEPSRIEATGRDQVPLRRSCRYCAGSCQRVESCSDSARTAKRDSGTRDKPLCPPSTVETGV